ncbi:MAG: hypothetical protein OXG38_13115 [Chloroflexi bacterium]|nr:hypothetical protein [Chloroflexota bacterium]
MARTLAEAVGRDELQGVEDRLTAQIRGNTERLDDIDVKLGRVDSRLVGLEERGIRMEADVATLKQDVGTLKQDMTTIKQNLESIQPAVMMLVERAPDKKD